MSKKQAIGKGKKSGKIRKKKVKITTNAFYKNPTNFGNLVHSTDNRLEIKINIFIYQCMINVYM